MSRISIILLVFCLLFLGSTKTGIAQATANGEVTDASTGNPLEGAHVYLSGTKIGTATNAGGHYRLQQIPAGGYRVVVSMVGYKTKILDLVIGPDDNRNMDFELKPAIYKLPEIYVGDLDENWKENLERFTDHFIGETDRADSVEILNPEVLRFDKNWWGKMTAEAMAPLQIENRALGYHIIYHLEEFSHTGTRTRWDGEPLFSEMAPTDSSQAAYWENNRRKAFYGSLRHFLLALLDESVEQEGFILYNHRRGVRGYTSRNRNRISGGRLIDEGEENYLYDLNFFGRLEIIYTREEEDEGYRRWYGEYGQQPAGVQTSYLELNEHPITVDSDGEIIQPYGATQFGYYAYNRLADLTPREYRPDGYGESSEAKDY